MLNFYFKSVFKPSSVEYVVKIEHCNCVFFLIRKEYCQIMKFDLKIEEYIQNNNCKF